MLVNFQFFSRSCPSFYDAIRLRFEDGAVYSAVCSHLWCTHVSQQSVRYVYNQSGYQCGVVQYTVLDTSEPWAIYKPITSGFAAT